MAGTLTISGLSATEPSGSSTIGPLTIVGNVVIGEKLAVPLSSGDNTFAVPAGSVAALILAPTNGSSTLSLRTNLNNGDVGLPIVGSTSPVVYTFPAVAPTSLIIKSSTAVAAPLTIVFI